MAKAKRAAQTLDQPGTDLVKVSAEELEAALAAGDMKEAGQALMAAEPVYGSQNIIRTKNKVFKLGDDTLKEPPQVIILAWSFMQLYYNQEYDPDTRVPPVCFAFSDTQEGLVPNITSPKIQNEGKACATCWANQPGSGDNGPFIRACSGRRRLAFLFANDDSLDPAIGSIELSSSALKPFSLYVKSLWNIHHALPRFFVTQLDFVDTKKDTWYVGASPVQHLARARPQWLTPEKGVKVGEPGWERTTLIGKKYQEVIESKMLLVPPQLIGPDDARPKGKRPVTGAKRVSVKDAKAARKARK